mmetsp:Transcript_48267/g.94318  ORF Transcript_48267/g.94318 Transcript_48267/m.94318 type:complete len:103 (-) Transcript_48267:1088-1396(-)
MNMVGLIAASVAACPIIDKRKSVIGALEQNPSIVSDTLEDKIASNVEEKINEKVKNDMQKLKKGLKKKPFWELRKPIRISPETIWCKFKDWIKGYVFSEGKL